MRQYTRREFIKLLRINGFKLNRQNGGHSIYCKGNRHISIPAKIESVIARRLIKENNLKVDIKGKKYGQL